MWLKHGVYVLVLQHNFNNFQARFEQITDAVLWITHESSIRKYYYNKTYLIWRIFAAFSHIICSVIKWAPGHVTCTELWSTKEAGRIARMGTLWPVELCSGWEHCDLRRLPVWTCLLHPSLESLYVFHRQYVCVHQLLVHPKDPVGKEKGVGPMYKISCEECEATYVGESKRSLKARFGEHRRPSSTTSKVSNHIQYGQSQPHHHGWRTRRNCRAQKVWESSEGYTIRALKPSLNRNWGWYNLPPIWNKIIKERLMESGTGTSTGGVGGGASQRNSVSVPGHL